MTDLLARAEQNPASLTRADLVRLLSVADGAPFAALEAAARRVREAHTGKAVYLRGLIEMGNRCTKDCRYCGLRRSNRALHRYTIPEADCLRMARWARDHSYGSIVLQSGELESEENTARIERILRALRAEDGEQLGITLSLGEQTPEVYRRWREAGADRYLLRIETSDPRLYAALHPADHSFTRRLDCLRALRALGYQVGTGVMIGLPGQTREQLADDLLFFRREGVDMIGMGPWLPHRAAPLGQGTELTPTFCARQLGLGLRMIAAARLLLPTCNIAAATALQALQDDGRERGLRAGANVVMPNITDRLYRADYQLYENKPCIGEDPLKCRGCLEARIRLAGCTVAWHTPGTPKHYQEAQ